MIDQIAIGLCGVTAVFLSQDRRESVRRYACLFGLVSQPFWFWATWKAGQYGIFALCFLYALSWMRGFYTHWIKAGLIKRLICRLFGHTAPDATSTSFWAGSHLVWQCPRCQKIARKVAR